MLTLTEHYLSLALFTYILSCLTFTAVRWFHICRPYDKQPDYYYPGRKLSVLVFLSALIMLPYALDPADSDAWMLLKSCYMILLPFYCAVLMSKYFGTVKQWNKWKRHAAVLVVPFGLTIAALLVLSIVPGTQTDELGPALQLLVVTEGILSVLFTVYCLMKIYHWLQEVNDENYSNEDDFPEQFASRLIWIVLFFLVFVWAVVIVDSQVAMAVANGVLALFNIYLLILVLHPHRTSEYEEAIQETITDEDTEERGNAPTAATVNAIVNSIQKVVKTDRRYLDPHLAMQDVVERCGFGRTYVSWVFKNKLGGFFHYVNSLRIDYAQQYQKEHPMATLDEVASASGFTNRQSLYRVRKRLGK